MAFFLVYYLFLGGIVTEAFYIPPTQPWSAVIDTTAKVASSPFTHGLWQQNRPQTSTWPLMSALAVDISMVSGGSTDHRH